MAQARDDQFINSRMKCEDGLDLRISMEEGRSPQNNSKITLIKMVAAEDYFETWLDEDENTDKARRQILHAVKHSPEFRETLRPKDVEYTAPPELIERLDKLGEPYQITAVGNTDQVPVHQEKTHAIRFLNEMPVAIRSAIPKTEWMGTMNHKRKTTGIIVRTPYGLAHAYNQRLVEWLDAILNKTPDEPLDKALCGRLRLTCSSTIPDLPKIPRKPVVVDPESFAYRLSQIIHTPLSNAAERLGWLKCGRDQWSSMKEPELIAKIENRATVARIQKELEDKADQLTTYRWILRGLPADYAIMKARLIKIASRDFARDNSRSPS